MEEVFSKKIEEQRLKVFENDPKVNLFAPCKIGEGILNLQHQEEDKVIEIFKDFKGNVTYFIPASGSGSRMFKFLYDFMQNPDASTSGDVERFMNHIQDFAFFHRLPQVIRERIKNQSIDPFELIELLMQEDGMNFSNLPKGLVPFHFNDPFVLNPFQEHVLQGTKMVNGHANFHFTVQEEYLEDIKASIDALEKISGRHYNISFSFQSKDSNSVAFDTNQQPLFDQGELVTRPAGHGALLENLNKLDEQIIFIKNIDNVQHYHFSDHSNRTWSILGGLLLQFQSDARELLLYPTADGLKKLNDKYQFLSPQQVNDINTAEELEAILNRPIRVAGMVKNEGQPGGGPFWIEDEKGISKQIVEKAQIKQKGEQYNLMVKSSHFNPVMIAVSARDLNGNKLDLNKFVDSSKYFVVKKNHYGNNVEYMELPGLWNGSMANWNTLFIQIPADTFSPVKTVLDLLDNAHMG